MTPEGKVKKMVKEALKTLGAYYFMPVQSGFGSPALDFYCCYKGYFFAIETKAPGKAMSPRQQNTANEIFRAEGAVFVVDGVDTMQHVLDWAAKL